MFYNKTVAEREKILEDINSETAKTYREKLYCYLNGMDYNVF